MAIINATEINFFLSGGLNNSNPNLSIGGNISTTPITGSVNNLFSNITTEEANLGKTDYRCFYIKNTSSENYLYESKIYIFSQRAAGSFVQVGVSQITDEQEISVTGSVISGDIVLRYQDQIIVAAWGGSLNNFAANLLESFISAGIQGVEINPVSFLSTGSLKILFKGNLNYRNQPILELQSNNFNGISKPTVAIKKNASGRPINSIADMIAADTVPPDKVVFENTNSENSITTGTLAPGDFFPVWLKRTTEQGTDFQEQDSFIFKIAGTPFL